MIIRGKFVLTILVMLAITACAPQQRRGMVVDPQTGLQFGSVIEKNLLLDASQFGNRNVKVRIRNTSGDPAFDLHQFSEELKSAYRQKGYSITDGNDFGMLIDVNVTYSGQVSSNLSGQYGFLGAAIGGVSGGAIANDRTLGAAAGVVAGAALGSIVGSYVTDDTYIVVAYVSLGVAEPNRGKEKTTIVFSSSQKKKNLEETGFKPFRQRITTGISVFAGGRSVPQSRIAGEVRERFKRIISDVI